MKNYTQEELAYIFDNYMPVTEYPTGDKIYLPEEVLDELQAEGIVSWDDDPPAQWGFNKEDRKKVEAALLGYERDKRIVERRNL